MVSGGNGDCSFYAAVASVEKLSERLVAYVTDERRHDPSDVTEQREVLTASLGLMRKSLFTLQSDYERMAEESRKSSKRIEDKLQQANQQVGSLRHELRMTNDKVREITSSTSTTSSNHTHVTSINRNVMMMTSSQQPSALRFTATSVTSSCYKCKDSNKAREEKVALTSSNRQLRKEMENLQQQIVNAEKRHQHTAQGYKREREELKVERVELLNQMQEMQKTIDDKEEQLREFIREFNQQTKENEEQIEEAEGERRRLGKERSELARHNEHLQLTVETLRQQLMSSEQKMRQTDAELQSLRQMINHNHHHQNNNNKRRSQFIIASPPTHDDVTNTSRSFTTSQQQQEPASSSSSVMTSQPPPPSSPPPVTGGGEAEQQVTSHHVTEHAVTSRNSCSSSTSSSNNNHDHDDVISETAPAPNTTIMTSSTRHGSGSNSNVCVTSLPNNNHHNSNSRTASSSSAGGGGGGKHHHHQGLVQSLSGSLSRAFKRHRTRKSLDASHCGGESPYGNKNGSNCKQQQQQISTGQQQQSSSSVLFDKTCAQKKELLEALRTLPMASWKAEDVAVWFELHMHMGQYVRGSMENVKSGKVLLGLSETEIERDLGMEKILHRRKLSLALDEFKRNPSCTLAGESNAGQLDHWWVSEQWLSDVSLGQHAPKFREHLVDGRVLSSLTRKDLDKHLEIRNRHHQESALFGIKLLRMFNFDVKRLNERRQMNEGKDCDLLVWTCSRLIQWIKSIDLKEYAANLRDSGLHGAMIVLDPTFSIDDVADAVGIPVNKTSVRRHLASEFDSLLALARTALADEFETDEISNNRKMAPRSSFEPFVRGNPHNQSQQRKTKGIRSSFTRSISRTLRDSNGK